MDLNYTLKPEVRKVIKQLKSKIIFDDFGTAR